LITPYVMDSHPWAQTKG